MVISTYSLQHRRPQQEDYSFYRKTDLPNVSNGLLIIAGVVDGHGGGLTAFFVSKYLPENIELFFYQKHRSMTDNTHLAIEEIKTAITDIIEKTDSELLKKYNLTLSEAEDEDVNTSGAVASFYVVYNKHIIVFQIGDSRVMIFNSKLDNPLIFETPRHNVHNVTEKQRVIDAGGGWSYDGRVGGYMQPSRVFGDFHIKKCTPGLILTPEIFCIKTDCNPQSICIISCTDGADAIKAEDFNNFFKIVNNDCERESLESKMEILKLLEKDRHDNVTMQVHFLIRYEYN